MRRTGRKFAIIPTRTLPPMHAPFCFGIRTFFLNWSRGKPYENNKQREWERKRGKERESNTAKAGNAGFRA